MTSIQRAGNDGYAATIGKAALGATVPLAVIGATVKVGGQYLGAVPMAALGLGGGLAAVGVTKFLEHQGLDQRASGIVGGLATAGGIMGVAALYGATHGGIGIVPAMGLALLPAFGAVTGGLTVGLWS